MKEFAAYLRKFLADEAAGQRLTRRAGALARIALSMEGDRLESMKAETEIDGLVGDHVLAGIVLPLIQNDLETAVRTARQILDLRAANGGIYLSSKKCMDAGLVPQGDISFMHCITVHKAFRMLVPSSALRAELISAMEGIERLFQKVAFNNETGFFDAGGKLNGSDYVRTSHSPPMCKLAPFSNLGLLS